MLCFLLQLSGEPTGPFLSLLLSRSGSASAVPACRYCHGDLILLYIPSTLGENEGKRKTPCTVEDGSKGNTEGSSEKFGTPAEPSRGDQSDDMDVQRPTRPLRARDTECHVLGVVSQGQHESITVKVLTPSLGQTTQTTTQREDMGAADPSAVLNPATGRPDGCLLPRDRRRMTRLARALNAQLTNWTVHRLLSLTTLHREFQVRLQNGH